MEPRALWVCLATFVAIAAMVFTGVMMLDAVAKIYPPVFREMAGE